MYFVLTKGSSQNLPSLDDMEGMMNGGWMGLLVSKFFYRSLQACSGSLQAYPCLCRSLQACSRFLQISADLVQVFEGLFKFSAGLFRSAPYLFRSLQACSRVSTTPRTWSGLWWSLQTMFIVFCYVRPGIRSYMSRIQPYWNPCYEIESYLIWMSDKAIVHLSQPK